MSKRAFRLVNNPLVHTPNIPNGAPALDVIEAKHFLPAIDWAIDKARANIAAITATPDAPSFENIVEAIEFADQ